MEKNLPEKKFTTGVITATIWKNKAQTKDGKATFYHTISLQRRYTDKEGNWKSTGSLRVNDLPKASLVLNKAYEYLVLQEKEPTSDDEVDFSEEEIVY